MTNSDSQKSASEFDAFKALVEKLIQVPEKEIKAERDADKRGKPKLVKKPARKRKGS